MRSRRKGRTPRVAGPELDLTVEKLPNGPGALARADDGRVVMLDDGLPGERVRAQVLRDRGRYLEGRVIRRLDPASPDRRDVPCPVAQLCGGCPWQALRYDAQVRVKQEVVTRELERLGGVVPRALRPSVVGPEWRSRHRIRLAVKRARGEAPRVGYRPRGGREVVPIEDCAIARAELVAALPLARRLAARVDTLREIELSVDDRGGVRLLGRCDAKAPIDPEPVWQALRDESTSLAGLVLQAAGAVSAWRIVSGDEIQRIRIQDGVELEVPLGAFTQVNADLQRELVAAVKDACGDVRGKNVLDLYCGAGNFSLPLAAAGATVLGIDSHPGAIAAADKSARALGLEGQARFVAGKADAEAVAACPWTPDIVVLDPPRAGAAEPLPAVLQRRPQRIVYVSCDVATFARDARAIVEAGGSLESFGLIDLTPQTYRAEVLGVFQLTWERGGPYRDV